MSQDLSTFDKIKLVFVALGTIGAGIFFANGPEDLRQEIPIHFELGVGFAAFGFLMLAALFSVRAKSLLLFFAMSIFTALFGIAAYNSDPTTLGFYGFSAGALMFGVWALWCFYAVFSGDDPAK